MKSGTSRIRSSIGIHARDQLLVGDLAGRHLDHAVIDVVGQAQRLPYDSISTRFSTFRSATLRRRTFTGVSL
jgi:hypothetical protein